MGYDKTCDLCSNDVTLTEVPFREKNRHDDLNSNETYYKCPECGNYYNETAL